MYSSAFSKTIVSYLIILGYSFLPMVIIWIVSIVDPAVLDMNLRKIALTSNIVMMVFTSMAFRGVLDIIFIDHRKLSRILVVLVYLIPHIMFQMTLIVSTILLHVPGDGDTISQEMERALWIINICTVIIGSIYFFYLKMYLFKVKEVERKSHNNIVDSMQLEIELLTAKLKKHKINFDD